MSVYEKRVTFALSWKWFELCENLEVSTQITASEEKWRARTFTSFKASPPSGLSKLSDFKFLLGSRGFWDSCTRWGRKRHLVHLSSLSHLLPTHRAPRNGPKPANQKKKKKERDSVRPHKHKSSFSHKPAHTHTHTYPVIKPTGKLCHSINVSFYLVLTYLPSSAGIKASPLSPPSLPSPSCTHFLSLSLFNSLSLSLSSCTQCAGLSTVVITSILKKKCRVGLPHVHKDFLETEMPYTLYIPTDFVSSVGFTSGFIMEKHQLRFMFQVWFFFFFF